MKRNDVMTDREAIDSLIAMNEKDSAILSAFEACGRVIESMKSDKLVTDIRIKNLETRVEDLLELVAELEKELAAAKGGKSSESN